ncbi:MAG: hypothetical protein H0T62_11105 [Parachlamydiaceae bacterium]|nr:hypothetical protein [Parachlamydiaceae bacterium]
MDIKCTGQSLQLPSTVMMLPRAMQIFTIFEQKTTEKKQIAKATCNFIACIKENLNIIRGQSKSSLLSCMPLKSDVSFAVLAGQLSPLSLILPMILFSGTFVS